ncbi:hypothetical protein K7X08_020863 [Anisodus acutangulus]|uniref:Uncharacterized protein n=1 Tax=Anisodus acutangulus TaxID=402998 RepID=A0A9Q1RRJ5_9SOLA|nr:hypothetical protein K7X08_020863 [Anisodus acutangulus]
MKERERERNKHRTWSPMVGGRCSGVFYFSGSKDMEFFFRTQNEETSDCPFNGQDIQRCPFLSNINKPTSLSFFSALNFPNPVKGGKGPIFEDGPNFDMAFKVFHGKDGVVPLSGRLQLSTDNEVESTPQFDPLAAKAATISLSSFGPGGPFSFDSFSRKWNSQKKRPESSQKKKPSSRDKSSKHEATGNEWCETGNCPLAKSFRAVSGVLPSVASAFQLPPELKLKCPPAVVAARTAFVKTVRPQPLSSKMLVIGALGMAANIPLGVWREHTEKFSLSWFTAVHAAVPFIAMLRKSVVMPKTAMALTIAASILGQVIGSRAERLRMKAKAGSLKLVAQSGSDGVIAQTGSDGVIAGLNLIQVNGMSGVHCGTQGMLKDQPLKEPANIINPSASLCF